MINSYMMLPFHSQDQHSDQTNPRPVATIKTGHVRMCLLLVARCDRYWL